MDNLYQVLTDDTRNFHIENSEYNVVQSCTDAQYKGGGALFHLQMKCGEAMSLWVMPITRGIFRIKAWKGSVEFLQHSPMLERLVEERIKKRGCQGGAE